MGHIYGSAREVFVWLSFPIEESGFVMHRMAAGSIAYNDAPFFFLAIAEFCHQSWFERT